MLSHTQIVILKKEIIVGAGEGFVGRAQHEQRVKVAHGGRAVLEVVAGVLVTLVESWF